MASFATKSDLEARWRILTPSESSIAEVLLEDASIRIRALYATVDARIAAETLDAGIPKQIVCSMVQRAMASNGLNNVNSVQETAGPFSQSVQYANPSGDLYLTKAEKTLLRGSASGAFSIDLGGA